MFFVSGSKARPRRLSRRGRSTVAGQRVPSQYTSRREGLRPAKIEKSEILEERNEEKEWNFSARRSSTNSRSKLPKRKQNEDGAINDVIVVASPKYVKRPKQDIDTKPLMAEPVEFSACPSSPVKSRMPSPARRAPLRTTSGANLPKKPVLSPSFPRTPPISPAPISEFQDPLECNWSTIHGPRREFIFDNTSAMGALEYDGISPGTMGPPYLTPRREFAPLYTHGHAHDFASHQTQRQRTLSAQPLPGNYHSWDTPQSSIVRQHSEPETWPYRLCIPACTSHSTARTSANVVGCGSTPWPESLVYRRFVEHWYRGEYEADLESVDPVFWPPYEDWLDMKGYQY